jgi:anti-sigma B factor antagonist
VPDALAVAIRCEGAATVVEIAGEIDLATFHTLNERLEQLIRDGRRRIVLDMSRVSFIDSTGLGGLIRVRKAILAEGGILELACLQTQAMKVFEITNLTELFSLHDNVAQALAAIVGS